MNEFERIGDEADMEQLAYLEEWRKQQAQKKTELGAVRQRAAEGKESHLRAVCDAIRIC